MRHILTEEKDIAVRRNKLDLIVALQIKVKNTYIWQRKVKEKWDLQLGDIYANIFKMHINYVFLMRIYTAKYGESGLGRPVFMRI